MISKNIWKCRCNVNQNMKSFCFWDFSSNACPKKESPTAHKVA